MPSRTKRDDSTPLIQAPRPTSSPPTGILGTERAARQFPGIEFPEAVALALVLLIAALLRLYRIGEQSLWADEGNSWAMAIRPLGSIAAAVSGDIHPPLYYYILNLWARLAGTSEAGLRGLSALFGWLLVLSTYLWARRTSGPVVGLIAGLLAAVSPLAIYYSQEARAYSLMALLATLVTLAFTAHIQCRTAGGRGRLPLVLYTLAAAALLWTHYLGGANLLLANLFALAWIALWRGPLPRRQRLLEWAVAQVAIAVLFAPWLPVVLRTAVEWPAISTPQSLAYYLREAARLYTIGPASAGIVAPAGLCVAVALVGAAAGWLRRRGLAWSLTVAAAVWMPVVMWLVSLVRPAYRAKFLLAGLPAFHILAATASVSLAALVYRLLRRPGRNHLIAAAPAAIGAVLLLVPQAIISASGMDGVYNDSRYARDDYRAIAGFLEAAAGEGDAVVLNAPGQIEVFSYYYHGPAKVYPLPLHRPADRDAVVEAMAGIAAEHERVFAVLWATGESDPQSHVESWLGANAYKATDAWYGNVRLATYELPSLPLQALAAPYDFGGVLSLDALAVGRAAVSPGAAWPVELHWRLTEPTAATYKLFLQALDANSSIVGQRDVEPLSAGLPTSRWTVGEEVLEREAVPISLGTPPGLYRVVGGLYDPNTGARLLLADGSDHIELGTVQVTAAPRPVPAEAIRPLVRARIGLGALRLLGWDASALGSAPSHAIAAAAGQPLSVVLYWTVEQWGQVDLEFALDNGGDPLTAATQAVLQGYALPTEWPAGALVRDPHIILVPPDLPPGRYRLSVAVRTAGGEGTVDLAAVVIAGP